MSDLSSNVWASVRRAEAMSSRYYDAPDDVCDGECIVRAQEDDPNIDEETVECDCEQLAEEAREEARAIRMAESRGIDY